MRTACVALVLAASVVLCACDGDGDDDDVADTDAAPGTPDAAPGPDAAPVTTETHQYTLPAGSFKEPTLMMQQGATLMLAFTATGTLEWNLHAHAGGATKYLLMGEDASHAETFTAPATGEYYLLWKNPTGAPSVTLDVTLGLGEGATLVNW